MKLEIVLIRNSFNNNIRIKNRMINGKKFSINNWDKKNKKKLTNKDKEIIKDNYFKEIFYNCKSHYLLSDNLDILKI